MIYEFFQDIQFGRVKLVIFAKRLIKTDHGPAIGLTRTNNTETFHHRGRTLDFFSYQTSLLCLYALYIEQGSFR